MSSTYDLSWGTASFLAKLRLFVKSHQKNQPRIHSGDSMERSDGYSALSSTYYTIAGTADAHRERMIHEPRKVVYALLAVSWTFSWFPLGSWCWWRMLHLSNKSLALAGGYGGMTASKCDVRQSVLRARLRFEEAEACILRGLTKAHEPHTRGLLYVGLVDINCRFREDPLVAGWYLDKAIEEARKAEEDEPRQAARIYKKCASIPNWVNSTDPTLGDRLRDRAMELAQQTGSEDQVLKIQART